MSANELTAVDLLLVGIGALLFGLGVFFWGVRHLFFARRELEAERAAPTTGRPVSAA